MANDNIKNFLEKYEKEGGLREALESMKGGLSYEQLGFLDLYEKEFTGRSLDDLLFERLMYEARISDNSLIETCKR